MVRINKADCATHGYPTVRERNTGRVLLVRLRLLPPRPFLVHTLAAATVVHNSHKQKKRQHLTKEEIRETLCLLASLAGQLMTVSYD